MTDESLSARVSASCGRLPTDLLSEAFSDGGLRRQAGGLRRVAHAILRDEHAAEDAVQDAWVAALEKPPRAASAEATGLFAWFRQVTRRQALRQRRGAGRREARERVVARTETLGSAADEVARREVLREVVDSVLTLPEPYQTAVLLRYFEDLSPRAIAARTGTSVATVDSRLHRARALLRERLDAKNGGDRSAWAPALAVWTGWKGGGAGVPATPEGGGASPPAFPNPEAITAGGTTMQSKLLLAGGVAALVGGGTWVAVQASSSPESSAQPAPTLVATDDAGTTESVELSTVTAAPEARRPSASEDGAAVELVFEEASHVLAFRGQAFDSDDQPLTNATLWVAQAGHPWNVAGRTDHTGAFDVSIQASVPEADLYAFFDHPSASERGFRVFRVSADTPPVRIGHNGLGEVEHLRRALTARSEMLLDQLMVSEERLALSTLSPSEYEEQAAQLQQELVAIRVQSELASLGRLFRPASEHMIATDAGQLFSWSALTGEQPGDYTEVAFAERTAQRRAVLEERREVERIRSRSSRSRSTCWPRTPRGASSSSRTTSSRRSRS